MTGHDESSKQYEKFVLDFVNAKTSDEIFLKVLTNIAEIFNISSEFKENMLGIFPSRKEFLSLPKIEKQLLVLLIKQQKHFLLTSFAMDRFFYGPDNEILSIDFDDKGQGLLTFEQFVLPYDSDSESDQYSKGIQTMSFEELQQKWEKKHLENLENGEAYYRYNDGDLEDGISSLRKLFVVEKAILHFKKRVHESRFEEIKKLTGHFKYIFWTSRFMRKIQRCLRNIFEEIIKRKDPTADRSHPTP